MPGIQTTSLSEPYGIIEALPEGLTGEILDGQVHAQSRPSTLHGFTSTALGSELTGPFQKGRGGPGGWWIIHEPEIHFLRNVDVARIWPAGDEKVRQDSQRATVSKYFPTGFAKSYLHPQRVGIVKSSCRCTPTMVCSTSG